MEPIIIIPLSKVKGEAARILAIEPTLPALDAYSRAIASIVMAAAEKDELSPFEQKLLTSVWRAQKANGDLPVQLQDIRPHLRRLGMTNVDRWVLWSKLAALERRHLLVRAGRHSKKWACSAVIDMNEQAIA